MKPLNHSINLRDNTSFSPKGNSIVIDDLSVSSLVVYLKPIHPKWAIELSTEIGRVLVKVYSNKSPKKGN